MIFLFLISVFSNLFCRTKDEVDKCLDYGFDPTVLECKTCEIVKKTFEDEELSEMCEKCCNTFKIVLFIVLILRFLYLEKGTQSGI
jgi:hypothetical protein